MEDHLKILMVEDNELDSELIVRILARHDFTTDSQRVDTLEGLNDALGNCSWDIVTCDYSMPHLDAYTAINQTRELQPGVPIIIVSGEIDIDNAVSLLRSGACDYVRKEDIRRLPLAIHRALENARSEYDRQKQADFIRILVDTIPSPVFYKGCDGLYAGCNPAFARILGVTPADIIGKDAYDISPPGLAGLGSEKDRQLLDNPGRQRYESVINGFGDEEYMVIFDKATMCDPSGNTIGIIGVITDITDLKLAQEALADSEQRYRILSQLSSDFVYSCVERDASQYEVDWITDAFFHISGFSRQDLQENRCWLFSVHPDDRELAERQLQHTTRGAKSVEVFRILTPGKVVRYLRNTMMVVADAANPDKNRIYGAAHDITENWLAGQAVRESEELFRAFFEKEPNYCFMLSPKGVILDANPSALQALDHVSPKTLMGRSFIDAVVGRGSHKRAMQQLQFAGQNGEIQGEELDIVSRLGIERKALLNTSAVCNESGELKHIIVFLTDITELREHEEEIRQLNEGLERTVEVRTAELQTFVNSVSHDLRAPLRAIHNFSQILKEDYGHQLDEGGLNILERILKAAQKQAEMMDALMNLARLSASELNYEECDLSGIAREIFRERHQIEPHRIVKEHIQAGMKELGDPQLLAIALENIIGNAWKYTSGRSAASITFASKPGQDGEIYYITDNGTGFDSSRSEVLFNAFKRGHNGCDSPGYGIGLSVVKNIIQRHGGKVWAESEIGKSSTFYFTLRQSAGQEIH